MKRVLYATLAILALIWWMAKAHVTMTAGTAQVTMPVLALVVTLAIALAVAAAAGLFAMALQEGRPSHA
jgi:hypothetical protein